MSLNTTIMFRLAILSVLVAVAIGAVPRVRSPRPQLDGRIVGGKDVNIEDYPYQVSLLGFGSHRCGGSIVTKTAVITAAHCTDGLGSSSLKIRASSSIKNSGGQVIDIKEVRQHPDYDAWNIDYDISVLILAEDIELGSGAAPIDLPSDNEEVPEGSPLVVSGWGALTGGGSSPSQLQAVEVPAVTLQKCKDAYGSSSITERMICAGLPEGGKDACQGDSGGPLVGLGGKLVGVVSWGAGCALPNYPGVYASVPNLRSYVREVLGI